jgi:hypothetical protein
MTAHELVETLLEDLEAKLPHLLRQFPEFGQERIAQIAQADPTTSKTYITWLLRQTQAGNIEPEEDAETLRDTLAQFDQFKRRNNWQGERDINRYQAAADLYDQVERYHQQNPQGRPGQGQQNPQGIGREVGRSGPYRMYEISTPEQAMQAAQGTAWCVSGRETARRYLGRGTLHMLTKNGRPYVLIDLSTGQARNTHDRTIDAQVVAEIAPFTQQVGQQLNDPRLDRALEPQDFRPELKREALRRRLHLYQKTRELFITEQTKGFIDSRGQRHPPTTKANAEAAFNNNARRFWTQIVTDPAPEVMAPPRNLSFRGSQGGPGNLVMQLFRGDAPEADVDETGPEWPGSPEAAEQFIRQYQAR